MQYSSETQEGGLLCFLFLWFSTLSAYSGRDKSLSVYEGAVAPWRSEVMGEWLKPLLKNGIKFDFPIHRPYNELSTEEKDILWDGNEHFDGINQFFKYLESKTHKIQYRVLLSRYRGRTTCPDCKGTRLRKDAGYVKISNTSIIELVLLPIEEVAEFFDTLNIPAYERKVSQRILTEIRTRLEYMVKVGLGYLTLNRLTSSLSGGEYQRIKLAIQRHCSLSSRRSSAALPPSSASSSPR
jgi:excinuclease ABC subunit A